MFKLRSASPPGARKLTAIYLPVLILVLAVLSAAPAHSKKSNAPNANAAAAAQSENPPKGAESDSSNNSGKSPATGDDGDGGDTGDGDAPNDVPNEELRPPPSDTDDATDELSAPDAGESTSIFRRSSGRVTLVVQRYKRTQKELARLFVLTDTEIAVEFPNGGFDTALVQAANRARRAERAYLRR